MSSSGSGRNDPQPSSTAGSKSAQSTDASSEEQDLGKENHEQKIKSVCREETPVPGKVSAKMINPVNGESNSGFSNFGNRIKRTFSFTGSGNDGAKAEPSPDPVEISTRSTRTPKAKPKSSESGHSKPKRKSKVVNAAVRPAECHGPLNPKKKLVKPTKEPKEDASEREQRTDAVAVREKPGASVTQYKIVYSAKPLKATASPTNEQQAKVEDKDTPTSCYMFYQR
ncbi:hypothetical protein AAVH_00143 [Aphelenchoides avenae]|nr:hypothetical protein AAVH_00143 [Aphelenchus avenae]